MKCLLSKSEVYSTPLVSCFGEQGGQGVGWYFLNDVGTESLMDRFSNGQSIQWTELVWLESQVDRGIVGQS